MKTTVKADYPDEDIRAWAYVNSTITPLGYVGLTVTREDSLGKEIESGMMHMTPKRARKLARLILQLADRAEGDTNRAEKESA